MVDIIKNKNMLTNIRPPNNPVEITGIGGTKIRVNHIGDLSGYGSVYFHTQMFQQILFPFIIWQRDSSQLHITTGSKMRSLLPGMTILQWNLFRQQKVCTAMISI